jgi:hypothetical protein
VAEKRPDRGQLAPDGRRCELARPPAPELRGVVGEHAHVHRAEPCPAPLEPAGELLHVHAVGATGRLGQGGAVEEALDLSVHGGNFSVARAIPAKALACDADHRSRTGSAGAAV